MNNLCGGSSIFMVYCSLIAICVKCSAQLIRWPSLKLAALCSLLVSGPGKPGSLSEHERQPGLPGLGCIHAASEPKASGFEGTVFHSIVCCARQAMLCEARLCVLGCDCCSLICRPASSHTHPWAKAAGFDSGPSSTDSGTHIHTQHYTGAVPGAPSLPEQQQQPPPPQPGGAHVDAGAGL